MKNGIFYTKFLFVLLGLVSFASVKAADPIVVKAADATAYEIQSDTRTGNNAITWTTYYGPAAHGTYLEWTVSVPTEGTYDFTLQYATRSDRRMLLKINNQIPTLLYIGADNYSTNENTNDGTKTFQVYLNAGDNTIRISAFQYAGKIDNANTFTAFIDQFTLTPSAVTVAKLPDEFSIVIPAQETTLSEGWDNVYFTNTDFSGVTQTNSTGGYLEYDEYVPEGEEGSYNLVINYAGGFMDNLSMNLIVNEGTENEFAGQLTLAASGASGDSYGWDNLLTYQAMTQFDLPAGDNIIKFLPNVNGSSYPNLEQLELVRYSPAPAEVLPEFPKVFKGADATTNYKAPGATHVGANGAGTWTGYSGPPAHGAYLEWNNVSVPTEGTYDLTLRYATETDRVMTLNINNQEPTIMSFGADDYSTDWDTNDASKTFPVYLDAGNNTVRMSALQLAGKNDDVDIFMPNVDQFTIAPSATSVNKLPDEYSILIPAQSATVKTESWVDVDYPDTGFHGVGGSGGNTGYLNYDVTIPEGKDGLYNLVINYACGWDNHRINIVVNEGTDNEFTDEKVVPGSGPDTWGDALGWENLLTYQTMTQFNLHAGLNSIKIVENSDGSAFVNIAQLQLFLYGEYNDATGIIQPKTVPDNGVTVYGLYKMIVISAPDSSPYTVYDISGKTVASGISSVDGKDIPVACSGIYIVKVNNIVKKVIVK